jgi:hypothetical protein
MALWSAACAPASPPIDPAADVAARHARALTAAAEATSPGALHDALALAYTGDALTGHVRARSALLRGRRATGATLRLDRVEHERARWVGGDAGRAQVELHWRLAGSVTHAGHTHPRHLRAAATVAAIRTPDGWRITDERPFDVVALPATAPTSPAAP